MPVISAVVVQQHMLTFTGHQRGPHMRAGSNRNQTPRTHTRTHAVLILQLRNTAVLLLLV